jgi:hypothetical protein
VVWLAEGQWDIKSMEHTVAHRDSGTVRWLEGSWTKEQWDRRIARWSDQEAVRKRGTERP